ncbi:hypothetical protein SAMD00019534_051390 [Acytostelium subglobosum LB1]|uniref:hypothetical protein n=1 Tax=Acytostelium subglobosum LB1 TaxID=1410327 RepID=UPI00064490C8|nr:hypothetical protein SAMD00019534_051390 [Acytostelium subglobosum LB1]GAM21964.1 hypothetical protein SAMD00019534_051390 [Acytostelium subglobosum LB1]|eukprot:XP_012755064.1 hypothetical protein SAMD00019534_051390 [Acytostelium subglobosum LB1]
MSYTFVVDSNVKETSDPNVQRPFLYSSLIGNTSDTFNPQDQGQKVEPRVISSSIDTTSSTIRPAVNSFICSAIDAYNEHMHLVIRPDDVWLALMNQFSFYLNANSETLRSKFVSFDGKKTLELKWQGSMSNAHYDQIAGAMTDQIANNIKDPSVREWVLPGFTATTNSDRVVGAFVLMAAMKNYFDYRINFLCGLPKVTIMGSPEDWRMLRQKAERLVEFDVPAKLMHQWCQLLLPVLDQFVMAAEQKPNTDWWSRIAHSTRGSGARKITGWITVFMPFTEKGEWRGDQREHNSLINMVYTSWLSLDLNDIPRGHIFCPLQINDNGTEYLTDIYAGHIISKIVNKNTLVPQLDWCILLNQ